MSSNFTSACRRGLPRDAEEAAYCDEFRRQFGFDLRFYGLPPPSNADERRFLERFAQAFKQPPAPPYPRRHGRDRHLRVHVQGRRWPLSTWRRSALTGGPWLGRMVALVLYHRPCSHALAARPGARGGGNVHVRVLHADHSGAGLVFLPELSPPRQRTYGSAQTMAAIVLFYLMIGPSGAALSVDRLLARRWGSCTASQASAPTWPCACCKCTCALFTSSRACPSCMAKLVERHGCLGHVCPL